MADSANFGAERRWQTNYEGVTIPMALSAGGRCWFQAEKVLEVIGVGGCFSGLGEYDLCDDGVFFSGQGSSAKSWAESLLLVVGEEHKKVLGDLEVGAQRRLYGDKELACLYTDVRGIESLASIVGTDAITRFQEHVNAVASAAAAEGRPLDSAQQLEERQAAASPQGTSEELPGGLSVEVGGHDGNVASQNGVEVPSPEVNKGLFELELRVASSEMALGRLVEQMERWKIDSAEQLKELEREHEKQLQQLHIECCQRIEKIVSSQSNLLNQQVCRLSDEHRRELQDLREEFTARIAKVADDHAKLSEGQVSEWRMSQAQELQQVRAECAAQVVRLVGDQAQAVSSEMQKLNKEHGNRLEEIYVDCTERFRVLTDGHLSAVAHELQSLKDMQREQAKRMEVHEQRLVEVQDDCSKRSELALEIVMEQSARMGSK